MVGHTWWTKAIHVVMARKQKRKTEDLEFPYTRLQQLQDMSLAVSQEGPLVPEGLQAVSGCWDHLSPQIYRQ